MGLEKRYIEQQDDDRHDVGSAAATDAAVGSEDDADEYDT